MRVVRLIDPLERPDSYFLYPFRKEDGNYIVRKETAARDEDSRHRIEVPTMAELTLLTASGEYAVLFASPDGDSTFVTPDRYEIVDKRPQHNLASRLRRFFNDPWDDHPRKIA